MFDDEQIFELGPRAENQRLTDLSLAMVIPWNDGFPQFWLNEQNMPKRMREILDATENEALPWEI
jgi:hypothetical protein